MNARQTRALLLLIGRHWTRRSYKLGAAPKRRRVPAPLVLTLMWCAYMSQIIWKAGDRCSTLAGGRLSATRWALVALLLFGLAEGLADGAPELGRLRSPLKAALLDELPIAWSARLTLMWLRNAMIAGLFAVVCVALAREQRHSPAAVLAFSMALYLTFSTVGVAVASLVRITMSSHARGRVLKAWVLLSLGGYLVLSLAGPLGRWNPTLFSRDPLLSIAQPLVGQTRWLPAFARLTVLSIVSLATISVSEWRGYDRLDLTPPKRVKRTGRSLDLRTLDRRLMWREGGRLALAILTGMIVIGALVASITLPIAPDDLKPIILVASLFIAYFAGVLANSVANAAAACDVAARPFLSGLPISPFDTLKGKVAALRLYTWPWLLCLVPLAVAVGRAHTGPGAGLALMWRPGVTIAAVWFLCDAATSVAFLGGGGDRSGARAPRTFDSFLLLIPLLGAVGAPSPLLALPPLAALTAITFEARRSASLAIRWVDDSADDAERETPVWRALVALAVFLSLQSLSGQLIALLPFQVSAGYSIAIAYGVSATVLTLLTLRDRPPMSLRFMPTKIGWLGLGLAGGVVSAVLAIGFVRFLHPGGAIRSEPQTRGEVAAFVVTIALLAPLAEEIFFRGWLQDVMAHELPMALRRWGFVLAAFAFAAAHVGSPFVPQFILGLVAGALYAATGSLLPGVFAHVVHNGLAMWLGA